MPEKRKWPDCDICGKPVRSNDGVLFINRLKALEVANQQRTAHARNLAAHDYKYEVWILGGSDLPDLVPWQWCHAGCFQDEFSDYWIDANRIDTPEKAMGWTLHLMEKIWLPYTGWRGMMHRMGYVQYA